MEQSDDHQAVLYTKLFLVLYCFSLS